MLIVIKKIYKVKGGIINSKKKKNWYKETIIAPLQGSGTNNICIHTVT